MRFKVVFFREHVLNQEIWRFVVRARIVQNSEHTLQKGNSLLKVDVLRVNLHLGNHC